MTGEKWLWTDLRNERGRTEVADANFYEWGNGAPVDEKISVTTEDDHFDEHNRYKGAFSLSEQHMAGLHPSGQRPFVCERGKETSFLCERVKSI